MAMKFSATEILQWQSVAMQLVSLGVTGVRALQTALKDAGADDATIALMTDKWNALVADVGRAAGQSSKV
jgi:hypothetical protein